MKAKWKWVCEVKYEHLHRVRDYAPRDCWMVEGHERCGWEPRP